MARMPRIIQRPSEGRSEEDVKEMIRRTYDITTSSIAPVDDGTMLAMNTQQPDNFSSWIV